MEIEVSVGEIVDKLSILSLKKEYIQDNQKLTNVNKEYDYLHEKVFTILNIDVTDYNFLLEINRSLWFVEDRLRLMESNNDFGSEFVDAARSVYLYNDRRADIKKDINLKYGSSFVEEKSYQKY
jgi:hypothetical protein